MRGVGPWDQACSSCSSEVAFLPLGAHAFCACGFSSATSSLPASASEAEKSQRHRHGEETEGQVTDLKAPVP